MISIPKPSGDCWRHPNECIWARDYSYNKTTDCEMCGEHICSADGEWPLPQEEVGEFWDKEKQTGVYGHASCGFDQMLELA